MVASSATYFRYRTGREPGIGIGGIWPPPIRLSAYVPPRLMAPSVGRGEQLLGSVAMGIALVEVCDQEAGVEDDHSGQSSRSRSNSPDS